MPEKTTQKEHGKKTAPPSEKEVQPEVVIQIPLAELHPFPDHPFQVRDDDSMRETAESVKAYAAHQGLSSRTRPATLRGKNGNYAHQRRF